MNDYSEYPLILEPDPIARILFPYTPRGLLYPIILEPLPGGDGPGGTCEDDRPDTGMLYPRG